MKTLFIAPALTALYLLLQTTGIVQAKAADGLDTLKVTSGKAAAKAPTFQHHLFSSKKRNVYRLAIATPEEKTEMRVVDQVGSVVHRQELKTDSGVCDLDVNLLLPGTYTIQLVSGPLHAEEKFTVE